MEFRGIMGGFYRISEWIMRLSVTNLLWIITAFPVFFFVLTIFMAQDVSQLQSALFAIVILSPFTLFPSTSAMFALARKWVMGDTDVPLLKTFFRGYKENYLQSMVGGIIFTLLFTILYFNFQFYNTQTGYLALLAYLFIVLGVVLAIALFYFFSIMTHLHMKLFTLIKNSILLAIGMPFRSIMIVLSNFAILYISFTQFTFLLPFFTGSVMAYLTFWYFYGGFMKMMDKHEKMKAEAEEAEEAQKLSSSQEGVQ